MKSLLAPLILFSIAATCHGAGNRVIDDLTALRRIGFEFTGMSNPAPDTVSFDLKVPTEFLVAEDIGTKPFAGISLVEFSTRVEPGPRLIGAHSSQVAVESRKSESGRDVARVAVRLSKLEASYLMVSFVHPGEGQWPLFIQVPLAGLIKQLEAEQSGASNRSWVPDLKSTSPFRGSEDQDVRQES